MGKSAAETAPPRWLLRVHAEGAQGIKAASGLLTFDAKPDPYPIFVLAGVAKQCPPAQDVEPVKYFTWPNAVVQFEVRDENVLLQTSLVVHVKDSDTLKDRYIGGASIPLGALYTGRTDDVLCQGKMFALEFEDEKLKKKAKSAGEIKLTISVVDTLKKTEAPAAAAPPVAAVVEKEEPEIKPSAMKPSAQKEIVAIQPIAALAQALPTEDKTQATSVSTAAVAVVQVAPNVQLETPAGTDNASRRASQQTESTGGGKSSEVVEKGESGVPAESRKPSLPAPAAETASKSDQPPLTATSLVKAVKIELVSARNLTRPTSVGALFDRKPDPMVTLEFHGLSMTSVALKDVDLKKPVEWTNTMLAFELPATAPPSSKRKGCGPTDLVVHVKDENLMKATYMGGGKIDMSEFFEPRSEATAWTWVASASIVGGDVIERIVTLTFSDEKLTKKKACGEMTLRFHFVMEAISPPASKHPGEEEREVAREHELSVALPGSDAVNASQPIPAVIHQEPAPVAPSASQPLVKRAFNTDIKTLSIELLCGRNLVKPTVKSLAKSMLKSLFDRKPDPYAVLVLGSDTRKCPAVNDVEVAFFEWKNAVQVYEFTSKPYPESLLVHIRDEDVAGADPYMGGARISMKDIWSEALERAASDPPGDPQLVKTYDLTFVDDKLTKQKACGSVTLRFRWIYADSELPVVIPSSATSSSGVDASSEQAEKMMPLPLLKPRLGFIYLRKMAVYNNKELLDPSLDLYIEASPSYNDQRGAADKETTNLHAGSACSSVLTDAMKGKENSPSTKVSWGNDELIVPICVASDDGTMADITIQLKDKNAIMADMEIALRHAKLKDSGFDFASTQPQMIAVELEPSASIRKATKSTSTVKFEAEVEFLPHDSPILSAATPEKHGGVVTVFVVRSLLTLNAPQSTKEPAIDGSLFGLHVDCVATKKSKGLLSFGKSAAADFRTDTRPVDGGYEDRRSLILWWLTCCFPVSKKQFVAAKEKESFEVEVGVRMRASKSEKPIGSLQLNLFSAAFTPTAALRTETIQFGALGSMQLEFAASFRALKEDQRVAAATKTAMATAPLVPSGYLHLIVLSARNLVSPEPEEEKVEELDPEVRISVEPKYIKRKENPVRSMLKTKPLENAGDVPTWNEYLRLEYRLPPPTPPARPLSGATDRAGSITGQDPSKYPPPIVQLGVYDIQMPGEKGGTQVIGKTELPLSAFLLPASADDGVSPLESIPMQLDVFLAGKKTGVLNLEGIYEPAELEVKVSTEDPTEVYRQKCRSIGRGIRDKSKKLKSGEMSITTTDLFAGRAKRRGMSGRIELRVVGFRAGKSPLQSEDRGLAAYLWLSSNIEDRRELKSRSTSLDENGSECQIEWDARLTLFTSDITTELLRSEILTLTGKPVGSLKLPLGGLQEHGKGGRVLREWHSLNENAVGKKLQAHGGPASTHEVLLELSFFADQAIFDPLAFAADATTESPAVVVINCRTVILLDVAESSGLEVACKCSLLGSTPLDAGGKPQAPVERTSFKAAGAVVSVNQASLARARWDEKIKLDIGGSTHAFIARSYADGTLPALRMELLTKRPNARFQDTLASTALSLVSVSQFTGTKVCRWLKFYADGVNDKSEMRLSALVEVEVAVFCLNIAVSAALKDEKLLGQALEDLPLLAPVPGVLCLRFLAGRNLVDVDANGEQDPYIIAKIIPRSLSSTTLQSACQTAVSLDGGRHPTWNTSVFELRVEDLLTGYVRLEVIDSNEEDHLPDAYIGAVEVSLASLFRGDLAAPSQIPNRVWQQTKSRWLEAWVPIYPVSTKAGQDDESNAGEIRVEFRFLTEAYYESASRQQSEPLAGSSPFSANDSLDDAVRGTLCLHIVQATGISCTKGMQPGARISSNGQQIHMTNPGTQSITDPVWGNEIVEISWPPETAGPQDSSSFVKVDIVDLAVRTANANAFAVLAFGQVDVSSFLTHPLAKSYHVYPLHGRKTTTISADASPGILIGCQFIPSGREKDASDAEQKQAKRAGGRSGSVHVKGVQAHFNVPAFLTTIPLGARLWVRLSCSSKGTKGSRADAEVKTIEIPPFTLAELVQWDGKVSFGDDGAAVLFKYVREVISDTSAIVANPIIIGEVVATSDERDASTSIAEFEVPIFDYVLFGGHLVSAWYVLSLVDADAATSARLGEFKLEVQFVPVMEAPPTQSKADQHEDASDVAMFAIEIKHATGLIATDGTSTTFVVGAELMGCSAETKPSVPQAGAASATTHSWSEVLDLLVGREVLKAQTSPPILHLELRDAADAKRVYGTCNWIVPKQYVASSSSVSDGAEDLVVPLQPSLSTQLGKNATTKGALPPAELCFRLIGISIVTDQPTPTQAGQQQRRRRGLVYVEFPNEPSEQAEATKGALVPASQLKGSGAIESVMSSSNSNAWAELSRTERRVVPHDDDTPIESKCLAILVNSSKPQVAVLDGSVLSSITKTPGTETFHRLPFISADSSVAKQSRLACKLMYVAALQGQLQIQLQSISWPSSKNPGSGLFRLEMRLLSAASQRWVSSPVGSWNRKSSEITWQPGKNEMTLGYTNADEVTEPAVQIVLVQVDENAATKKEAFGQIAVLSTITNADTNFRPATAKLSTIGSSQDTIPLLRLQLRFVREQFSYEELEAKLAAARETKALELAEGTATLKKAFAVMGGDEQTPVKIVHVKNYVATASAADPGTVRAREVLQHAADLETDGDLDQLFKLMDVNGDGQISWDEYVDHMQNVHALADAAAAQTIRKQGEASIPKQVDHTEEWKSDDENDDIPRGGEHPSRESEHDQDDSEQEEPEAVNIPARSMASSAAREAVQDVYKTPTPSGQATIENGAGKQSSSEDPRRQSSVGNKAAPVDRRTRLSEDSVGDARRSPTAQPQLDKTPAETRNQRGEHSKGEEFLKKKLSLLSTYVLDWKVDEVIQWMSSEMELAQYADAIQQNAVNGKLLLTLREEELESELGVTAVLHKRKIMNQIHEFQERFQYPPPEVVPIEKKRPTSATKKAPATFVTAAMASETPAFIKREQLVFQEKQRVKQAEVDALHLPKTLGQSRVFPTKTMLLTEPTTATRLGTTPTSKANATMVSTNTNDPGESFRDAMQDIYEAVHPDSPEKPCSADAEDVSADDNLPIPPFAIIQIGSITNTDELFEIVRQRIHQLSQLLLPTANDQKETWSDFCDDPDDDQNESGPPSEEQTGLRLVFDALRSSRRSSSTEKVSRLMFQEGMAELLSIGVSWHQFDLLFRRLDVDGDSELCWDEFQHVFTRRHISFERDDLLILQDALVNFVMDRLYSQQWTLSDLFKAFDRDGGGAVSIAEFATLVRFLFTSSTQVKRHQQHTQHKIKKRHVYLLMSCLDVSADRRISLHEFLRFFFVVWSGKLMDVQDQLLELETSSRPHLEEAISSLKQLKRGLRRALRTNFSRPFRDAMRCLDVSVPGPFTGLLARLQLQPLSADARDAAATDSPPGDASLQVWQVLQGQTSASHRSLAHLEASSRSAGRAASRLRVHKGRNELQRTRLTRARAPSRADATLQTPARHVALDTEATLKWDRRPPHK